jgi:LPS-assembly lipoprotein
MNLLRASLLPAVALVSLLAGCGFHPRKEAELPAAMQRVHIQAADPSSALVKDLAKALPRSGAEVVDKAEAGVAVMKISANTLSTEVLSVGGTARANEYSMRHHVEFSIEDAAGTAILPKQTIELSREFTFDATQALGVAAETDLLGKELERDMVQTILRRLEAFGKHVN